MDNLIRVECAKLIDDWKQKAFAYDGLIYMMLKEEPEGVVPLYIGTFLLILKVLKLTPRSLLAGATTTIIT